MNRAFDAQHRARVTPWGRGAIVAAFSMVAMPTSALTIEGALAEAARTNPAIQAAREAARATHERVPGALAAWRPTVRADAGVQFERIGTLFAGPPRISDHDRAEQSVGLSYTQNLFRSGRDEAALRQAEADVRQSHAMVADAEQIVLLEVATAYLEVVRARRTVELREASLVAFEARTREVRAQFGVGDRTQADIAQAEAEREVAAADVVSAKADLEAQRARFARLVGIPADALEAAGEPDGLPATLDEANHVAREVHPAVRAAEHAANAAGHAVRVAEGEVGPRVDLQGGITRTTRTVGDGRAASSPDSTDMNVSVRVSVPLYRGGAGGAQVRQARRVQAQRRDERLVAEREVSERVTSAWHDLNAARQRHAALEAAVEASRVALAGIRREADLGERTIREVLDAERDLVSRQVRVLSAQRDAIVGAYRLLEATGALTAQALGVDDIPDLDQEVQVTREIRTSGLLLLLGTE